MQDAVNHTLLPASKTAILFITEGKPIYGRSELAKQNDVCKTLHQSNNMHVSFHFSQTKRLPQSGYLKPSLATPDDSWLRKRARYVSFKVYYVPTSFPRIFSRAVGKHVDEVVSN